MPEQGGNAATNNNGRRETSRLGRSAVGAIKCGPVVAGLGLENHGTKAFQLAGRGA